MVKGGIEWVKRRCTDQEKLAGLFRAAIVSRVYATRECSIFIETPVFVVLDRWRPGFSRLEGGEFGRSTGKEIEQGEIRARVFFASNRPLNDRERRFLLRDLLPFSLSARHVFLFPLSLSLALSSPLSLLLFLLFLPSLFLLLVPPARGTKARCVNSRKNGLVLLFH